MAATIGDFPEPLMDLGVHIGKTGEAPQWPEVLPDISDGSVDFPFLPGRRQMAGAWNEVVLPSECEKAWMEAHERIVVFGDNGSQVVVPQLVSDATHRMESVNVTTHESLESLAMGKLDVQLPAVTLDQAERI